jgi:phospholipase/lecithinase/hemolysin
MKQRNFFLVVGICVCLAAGMAQGQINTIGVVGDSLTDEYQFADDGNHSAGRNWLEQLATCQGVDFGTFSEDDWGDSREQGYEYNWAKAGATTTDLINQEQHINLAAQITAGDIDLAVCWIGVNDLTKVYSGHYQFIYGGGNWVPMVDDAIDNAKDIVNEILGASTDVNLVLVTIPEVELNPALRDNFPSETGRGYVSDAIASYNSRLWSEVYNDNLRIAIADVYDLSLDILAEYEAGRNLFVGGYEVDLNKVGDDPDCIILNDQIHPGTITQGLMANVIVDAMNTFGAGIDTMTDQEILNNAGVPEPATLCILACGGWLCLRRRKR